MTKFVSRSDPGWAGKGENIDRWLTLEIRSLGVCACVYPFTVTLSMCVWVKKLAEKKRRVLGGHSGSKRGGQDCFHKGEAGKQ